MSRSSPFTIGASLWAATAAISLLGTVLFALVVWPREASTEEKLAEAQERADSRRQHRQGYRNHRKQNLPRALELYDEAIENRPEFVRVFFLRGSARLALADHQGAIEDFSKTLELVPDFRGAYNSRGVARYQQGDVEGALEDFERSMEAHPDWSQPYVNRGHVRRDLGDTEGAMRDYDKTIELQPLSALAYDSRGVLKYELGDLQGARADFDAAVGILKHGGPNYDCLRNRAALRAAQGDSKGAAEDLARYQKIHDERTAAPDAQGRK